MATKWGLLVEGVDGEVGDKDVRSRGVSTAYVGAGLLIN